LQGQEVEHVTLSGRVQNTTSGIFRNVKLGPDAHISGGTFRGTIAGDPESPAKIEFAKIPAGTKLSHVIIGNDVILDEGVILGDGVEFIDSTKEEGITDPQEETTTGTPTGETPTKPQEEETTTKPQEEETSTEGSEETKPCEKGKAISLDSDKTTDNAACFAGQLNIGGGQKANGAKLSKKDAKELKLSTTINPLSTQIGQPANILMVGIYQAQATNGFGFSASYFRHGTEWQAWDGNMDSLTAAQKVDALPKDLKVQIFEGDLSFMPGTFTVYVGIQLNDGMIHYNGVEPMQFEVEVE
jgi:hypothetical protein